jgi:hypothetical protein
MFDPRGFQPDSGSYIDLTRRITQGMKAAGVEAQIKATLRETLEGTLKAQQVILSRPERARLLNKISKGILADLLSSLDQPR